MTRYNVRLSRDASVHQVARIQVEASSKEEAIEIAWDAMGMSDWRTVKTRDSNTISEEAEEMGGASADATQDRRDRISVQEAVDYINNQLGMTIPFRLMARAIDTYRRSAAMLDVEL
jgi:hypothetical protein